MINQMTPHACPCKKSTQLIKNDTTDTCLKCGRFNINNNSAIDDPIEYWKKLPQLYKDLTVKDIDGNKYVPYFISDSNMIVYLELSDLNGEFEYVVAKFKDDKIDTQSAKRFNFMEFNKLMVSFSK